MDVNKPTISNRRLVLALLCAALTGWFCVAAPALLPILLEDDLRNLLATMVLLAIFGLPIALVATLVVGLPIALVARQKGWTGPGHAALFGLAGGFAVWAGSLGYRLLTATGSWGGGQGYVWEDGWPTALGWRMELAGAPVTAFIGLASALIAWRVAAPRNDGRSAG